MTDFQIWANALIVEMSGQADWRANFALGAGAVVVVALIVVGVWAANR